MNSSEYTAREIDAKLAAISDLLERMDVEQSVKLSRIEAQTIKTNGRVASLEGWQNAIKGGLGVLTLLVVPILIHLATHGFAQ